MSEEQRDKMRRRASLAVIGDAGALDPAIEAMCVEVGRRAVEAGFRLITGGLGGVMEAVSRGAHAAENRREGDVIGVLPGYDRNAANPFVDIAVPTGMQIGRNVIVVAMADVVLAVGGGSGTLSEIAIAWQLGKPLLALAPSGGWAEKLAGEGVDARRSDVVVRVNDAREAISGALDLMARRRVEPGDIGSGWRRKG